MSTRTSITYHEETVPMDEPLVIEHENIRVLDVRRIGPDYQYSYITWETEEVDDVETK